MMVLPQFDIYNCGPISLYILAEKTSVPGTRRAGAKPPDDDAAWRSPHPE